MNPFKNSKFQDIAYHGTSSEYFTILDKSMIQKNPEDGDAGYLGWGFYLTKDRDYAEEYGDNILSFYINVENPFDFTLDSYTELVDYLFNNCDNLDLRLRETLYVIGMIGDDRGQLFDANNSEEIKKKCRDIRDKYKSDDFDAEAFEDIKVVLAELAKDINNWLNGLFFYFGKELFLYFTSHGYDGVIALEGEEIVIYDSEQLKAVDDVKEDLELDVMQIPDWEAGKAEFMNKIKQEIESWDGVRDFEFLEDLYPERQCSVWYAWTGTLFRFKYKDLLEISFYGGGEIGIYLDDDGVDYIESVEDLEVRGIFTDDDYYDLLNREDVWSNGRADNNTNYFGFTVTPLKNNDRGEDYYSYDLGYDDVYDFSDFIPFNWIFQNLIPEFMEEYPEYFEEEPQPENSDDNLKEDIPTESQNKKPTYREVISDLVKTFGYVDANHLTDAVYLLPNGKILDTKGPYDKSQHENIADYISDKYHVRDKGPNAGSNFMRLINAVRITPWIPAIEVPNKRLNGAQENTFFDIIMNLSSKITKDDPLMVATVGGQQIEFSDKVYPADVLDSINYYYVFGELLENKNISKSEMHFLRRM